MPISVTLQEVAKLTQIVVDRAAVPPGELVSAAVALPLPGDSPALDVSAFTVDVHWRVSSTEPGVDANGFVVAFVTPKATAAGVTKVGLAAGDGAKVIIAPGGQLFMAWWNSTDYSDADLDPKVEIVEVTKVGPDLADGLLIDEIRVVRARQGTGDESHDAAGKTYRMRPIPPRLGVTPSATAASTQNIALDPGHGDRLPLATPTTPFMAVWWNATDYTSPDLDPTAEVIKVTNRAGDNLTVLRGQRATSDVAHSDAAKTYKIRLLQPQLRFDFIAPLGLNKLDAVFGFMPPFGPGASPPAPKPYWLIADLTLRRAGTGAIDLLIVQVSKASPAILVQGLSETQIANQLLGLFKVELPGLPVAPGVPLTARLRPAGAEDKEWDVESATEVVPKFDLAGKVQVDALFQPLGRIVNGVFGVANKILASGVRLLTPIVRILGFVGRAAEKFAGGIGGLVGKKNPLRGLNVAREIERLLRRLRIRDVDIFKGLEVPVDANIVNRNFTTNLVPRNAVPPLPGPSKLLPRVPTLEQQIEVMDKLPDAVSALPIAGSLNIPLSLESVTWELWRNDVTVAAPALINDTSVQLAPADGNKLPQTAPFGLIWWNDTVSPGDPISDPGHEVILVTAKALDTLTFGPLTKDHNAAGTHRMRTWPSGQLIPGPPVLPMTLSHPLPEVSVAPFGAGTNIPLAVPDIAKLPKVTPFWMVWFDAAVEPYADPSAEIIQINQVLPNAVEVVRGQKGTLATNHDAPGKQYKLRLLADYFELPPTAGRNFVRTFAIEPPFQPDTVLNLHVSLNSLVDPTSANLPIAVDLPPIPIRLLGFDPLAFAAQQIEIVAPTDPLEPCEELPVQLLPAIPVPVSMPAAVQIPIPLGALPVRNLQVDVSWEILNENQATLVEGQDYSLTGASALARSIIFVPELKIMRREEPTAALRHIRVRLSTTNPPLQQVLGPVTIPVLPLQVPLFVAAFKYRFFIRPTPEETAAEPAEKKGKEEVIVFLPEYYVTQAPEWVDSWEAFQSKINDIQARVARLLAVAGGAVALALPTAPNLGTAAITKLSLIRGALDYVANRAVSGKLEFLRGNQNLYDEIWYWAGSSTEGISYEHIKNAHTFIIANDAITTFRLRVDNGSWDQTAVTPGPNQSPICILWRNYHSVFGDPWEFWWIPNSPSWGAPEETTQVSEFAPDTWHVHDISASFDQFLFPNKYFPTPADLFDPPPS